MKSIDIKAFRKSNNLTQTDLGDYLGCTKAFISAIEKGLRPLPDEMYSKMIDNPNNWDISMLTEPKTPATDQPMESTLVSYLERKVSDQEILIRELYQQIGMLEAKLDLARKGEIASIVVGSSDAHAV
jgi:transcriptional regulator with XRE-family HTH domain